MKLIISLVPMFGATESHYFSITYQSHEEMISFQSVLVEPSDCIQSLYEICSSGFFCGYLNLEIICRSWSFQKDLKEWMVFMKKLAMNWWFYYGYLILFFPLKIENPWLYTRIKSLIFSDSQVWILRTKPAW